MTPNPVKVSIGMPVYNGERYLRAALDSLVGQTFTDFELIISDNDSTDGTEAICRHYAAHDSRIRYARNEKDIGAAPNMNHVLSLAAGEYFKWAAHDDLHAPTYLQKCVAVLDQDPSVVLCHSETEHIDSNGVRISLENHSGGFLVDSEGRMLRLPPNDPPRRLSSPRAHQRFADILAKPLVCVDIFGLVRTDVLRSTPGMGTFFGSDRVLLAELALRGRFHRVREALFYWRNHADQATLLDANSRQRRHGGPDNQRLLKFRFLPGYCRALWRTPLSLTERALCHLALFGYYAAATAKRWRRTGRVLPYRRGSEGITSTAANE